MRQYKNDEIIAFRAGWKENYGEVHNLPEPLNAFRMIFDEENGKIPVAAGCRVEEVELGGCKGERLTPAGGGTNGILIYLHGGGHVFGSALSHRHMVSRIADAANMVAYLSNHGLAPERPFPGGLDDANAFYRAICEENPSARIALGGESAGGNLAAALVLRLASERGRMPDCVYLLSAWLDLTQSGETIETLADDDLLLFKQGLEYCVEKYSGGADLLNPLVSPLFGDLSTFPPTLIQVSGDEILLSDSLRFAEKAALVGCHVELQVWPETVHAWPLFHTALSDGGRAIESAARWISGA